MFVNVSFFFFGFNRNFFFFFQLCDFLGFEFFLASVLDHSKQHAQVRAPADNP